MGSLFNKKIRGERKCGEMRKTVKTERREGERGKRKGGENEEKKQKKIGRVLKERKEKSFNRLSNIYIFNIVFVSSTKQQIAHSK